MDVRLVWQTANSQVQALGQVFRGRWGKGAAEERCLHSHQTTTTLFSCLIRKIICFKVILNYPLTEVRGITTWKKHKVLEATWQGMSSTTPDLPPCSWTYRYALNRFFFSFIPSHFPATEHLRGKLLVGKSSVQSLSSLQDSSSVLASSMSVTFRFPSTITNCLGWKSKRTIEPRGECAK